MIEFAICVLTGAIIAFAGVYVGMHVRPISEPGRKTDAPEKAEGKDDREEERRSRAIDEGIQNLMTYSVNGHDGLNSGVL